MITISIKSNFPDVAKSLDLLPEQLGNKAMASALNKTIKQGRTQMARGISQEYNLSYKAANGRLRITSAKGTGRQLMLRAALDAPGRHGMNLIEFVLRGAKGTKKAGTAGHVGFRIKRGGPIKFIRGARAAFIGNKGRTLFRRVGKERLPIEPVTTIDVPAMFNAARINSVVRQTMLAKFAGVFAHEASFFLERWKPR